MKEILFFTNTNIDLAKKIVKKSNLRLGKFDLGRFADQEIRIFIEESVKNKNIYVLGSSFPPADNILELLILINTLKINGAKKINLIIPYFGYARSDKVNKKGSALSSKLMIQLMETAGVSKFITVDLHGEKVQSFFKNPLIHLSAIPLLAEHFKRKKIKDLAIASPDLGGISRAKKFAEVLGIKNIIVVKKCRPGVDRVRILSVDGDVKGKNIIIVDDMIQTGGTLIKATRALKKRGAKNIYVAVPHLVFSGPSIPTLRKEKDIKEIIISDTIPANIKLPTKFKQISISDLLVDSIG